nr:hypothetical protein [Candidatus Njordarchaeota archaeon]
MDVLGFAILVLCVIIAIPLLKEAGSSARDAIVYFFAAILLLLFAGLIVLGYIRL